MMIQFEDDPLVIWFNQHHDMGGSVYSSYFDWNSIKSPQNTIVKVLEYFIALPPHSISEFINADIIDNEMPDRNIMEDASKIAYLCNEMMFDTIKFHPQAIHEPWYDRYRIHPGSGRLAALWLCGYENFKTIYTHFDEPGFIVPKRSIPIEDELQMQSNILYSKDDWLTAHPVEVETYYAFPAETKDYNHTVSKDSIWKPEMVDTLMPWEFLRYSEGKNFINMWKPAWRNEVVDLYNEMKYGHLQLGETLFEFGLDGKITNIIRKNKSIDIIDRT